MGTLTGADREAFLAQLAQDPALQSDVGYWQDRLLGLAARIEPVEPPAHVWRSIEASLERPDERTPAAPRRQATTVGGSSPPWWNRIGFWRGFSGLAFAASLVLASLLVLRQPTAPQAQYVAVLQSPDRQAGWLVQAADQGPVRLVPLVDPGTIPAGKSWQFWTKGKNASAPTSLGLVPGGALEIPRSSLPELGEEQLFEITLEPETGSPTGRPTGPILFVGKTTRT